MKPTNPQQWIQLFGREVFFMELSPDRNGLFLTSSWSEGFRWSLDLVPSYSWCIRHAFTLNWIRSSNSHRPRQICCWPPVWRCCCMWEELLPDVFSLDSYINFPLKILFVFFQTKMHFLTFLKWELDFRKDSSTCVSLSRRLCGNHFNSFRSYLFTFWLNKLWVIFCCAEIHPAGFCWLIKDKSGQENVGDKLKKYHWQINDSIICIVQNLTAALNSAVEM